MSSRLEASDPHESAAQLIPWLVNGTLSGGEADWLRAHLEGCEACRRDFDAERRLYESIRSDGTVVLSGEPALEKLLARIEADEYAAAARTAPAEPDAADAESRTPCIGHGTPAPALEPSDNGSRRRPWQRGNEPRRLGQRTRWRGPTAVRWLTAAVVFEALALGIGAWSWRSAGLEGAAAEPAPARGAAVRQGAAPYRTLATPAPRYGAGARVRVVFRSGLSLDQLQRLLQSVGAHIVDGPTDARVFTLGFAEPLSHGVLDARVAKLRADPDVLLAEPASGPP